MGFMNNISLALVSVFGAVLYILGYGGITIGNISSFVLYSRRFAGPINELANIAGDLQSAFAAADRVFKLLDEPSEARDKEDAVEMNSEEAEAIGESLKHTSFFKPAESNEDAFKDEV